MTVHHLGDPRLRLSLDPRASSSSLGLDWGPPFRASAGYSWAYAEGLAAAMIEDIARRGECLLDMLGRRGAADRVALCGIRILQAFDSVLDAGPLVERTASAFEALAKPSEAQRLRDAMRAAYD